MAIEPYTVVRDTREQKGYYFNANDTKYSKCTGTVTRKLDTGDYTIEGLEDILCVERKASPTEMANCLGVDKERFMAEIKRMEKFPHKFILCEFSIEDVFNWPNNAKIPAKEKARIKIRANYIVKMMMEFQINNGIHVLFCGDPENAQRTLLSIFKRVNEKYQRGD